MAVSGTRATDIPPRMDGFTSTLSEYTTALSDLNQTLKELEGRKERLQALLEKKQKHTAQLKGQLDAQRVRECGWKEKENAALQRIKELNEGLESAKQDLEKTREKAGELRQQKRKIVGEFEAEMRVLYSEFQNMKLLSKGETQSNQDIALELSQLEQEVAELEKKRDALLARDRSSSLHLDTLQNILNEGNQYLEEISKLEEEERTLKQVLEARIHNEDESPRQQDTASPQE